MTGADVEISRVLSEGDGNTAAPKKVDVFSNTDFQQVCNKFEDASQVQGYASLQLDTQKANIANKKLFQFAISSRRKIRKLLREVRHSLLCSHIF